MQIIEKIEVGLAQPRNRSVLWVDTKEKAIKWCGPEGWTNLAGARIEGNIIDIYNQLAGHDNEIKMLKATDITLDGKIAGLDTRVTNLEVRANDHDKKLAEHETKLADHSLKLAEHETRLNGHDEAITEESDKLTDLIKTVYTNHVYANIKVSPSMIFKNEATEVTITYSGGITGSKEVPQFTVKKDGVIVDIKNGGTETITLNDAVSKVKYSVTASAGGVDKSADATVDSYWPVYTFSSLSGNISAIPDTAKKEAVMSSPKGKTFTFNVNQDEYIYIAMPKDMSINGGTSSGFDVGLKYNKDINVLDKGVYHIYRTMQKQDAGTYSIYIN